MGVPLVVCQDALVTRDKGALVAAVVPDTLAMRVSDMGRKDLFVYPLVFTFGALE